MIPINQIVCGHAAHVLAQFPAGSVDLIVCSPPYYNAVRYDDNPLPRWPSYKAYFQADLKPVLRECARVLRSNGKACINSMIMPIDTDVVDQYPRRVENIPADIFQAVMNETDLQFYDEYIWQKQTSKPMFGSRNRPGNLLAQNTTERISVFVKPGKLPKFTQEQKEATSEISGPERLDLTQQVWYVYPRRSEEGHPSPYPEKLPARLIRMFTYVGEVVLDPYVGTGTTCAVAKRMGRSYIGIDIEPRFVQLAQEQVDAAVVGDMPNLVIGRTVYPDKDKQVLLPPNPTKLTREQAERKYKGKRYGRKAPAPNGSGEEVLP